MSVERKKANMIRSMTGYGRREAPWLSGRLAVEARSVNHRFLEVVVRTPRTLAHLEEPLKKQAQKWCARGRVEVSVFLHGGTAGARIVTVDQELAKQYHRALRSLQRSLRLGSTVDLALLSGFRDIFVVAEDTGQDPKRDRLVCKLLDGTLKDMDLMRRREGQALAKAVAGHMAAIGDAKDHIAQKASTLAQEAFARMKQRVEKLLGAEPPDTTRLHQELALYADRYDITEELVRLQSHMVQFDRHLTGEASVGKTLDFLLQELGREVNTIGSKANDADITAEVVRMKTELERIREQVQNIE
jgi:uncharacterized protein (TIGR00255 family)